VRIIRQTRRFRARLDEAPNVSAFVESSIAGMSPRLIMRLQLIVEELFVNTVTYGHGGDSEAPVDVSVSLEGDRVTLVYEDTAPAFDPFATVEAPDPAASLEARRVGGLGVYLVTQLAERCDYARTGDRNRVTVELPVR
jgi:anti-sigma regulatory factor (Ser/Thr protein kinase)